jgi:hypothetical protein
MKITLKNLHEATAQEVFDQVKNHLITQGEQSLNSGGLCLYRNANGLSCAAGCLISEEEYSPNFETNLWGDLIKKDLVPSAHSDLIGELQQIHDQWEESAENGMNMSDSLEACADNYGLVFKR